MNDEKEKSENSDLSEDKAFESVEFDDNNTDKTDEIGAQAVEQSVDFETPIEEVSPEEKTPETAPSPSPFVSQEQPKPKGPKKLLYWYKNKKKISIPLTILIILLIVLAVPFTRYKVLGLFIKKSFSVTVIDSETNKPISEAAVSLGGQSTQTDKDGHASIEVPVGKTDLSLSKKYYQDQTASVLVSLSNSSNKYDAKMVATGRQVPVSVIDTISKKPIADSVVSAAGTTVRTNNNGEATIVLPKDQKQVDGTVSKDGFNQKKIKIEITEEKTDKNVFTLTATGKIYFLSKLSGKIDVVKTNLDGTDRQTVLKGTGKEDGGNTILLASRDWKYLALLSKRDGPEKIFLIETEGDKLSVMDEGNATFTFFGWLNENFVYTVNRDVKPWQNNATSLKSFNASSKKITVLENSKAKGDANEYISEYIGNITLLPDKIFYTKTWDTYTAYDEEFLKGKTNSIITVNADGSNKQTLKSFNLAFDSYMSVAAYKPNELYINYSVGADEKSTSTYLEYENGGVKLAKDISDKNFQEYYPTYLLSPSGKQTSWYESRDGKNTLFVGNAEGDDGKELANLTDFVTYGWFSDEYLLYSKNSSELYIASKYNFDIKNAVKISDYHKPDYDFYGYGGGYGGF